VLIILEVGLSFGGHMNRCDAQFVVQAVWNGTQHADDRFTDALKKLGITQEDFFRYQREARRTERWFPKRVTLTPTSVGKRR
jgi:hypothetical protein